MFCRVSRDYVTLQSTIELVASKCERLVVYEHEEDDEVARTHIHFYMEEFRYTVQWIKDTIKKALNESTFAKTDWSFKEKNKDGSPVDRGSITYMSKGLLDPVYVKGFTPEELAEHREAWVERPKASQKYQTKLAFVTREKPSEAKKRKNDLIKEMIDNINAKQGRRGSSNLAHHTNTDIIDSIIDVLNQNNIVFGRYTVRDYYDTIASRTMTDDFKNAMCQMVSFTRQ